MAKYRKKPEKPVEIEVEAWRWETRDKTDWPEWIQSAFGKHLMWRGGGLSISVYTPEGERGAPMGHWILRNAEGEFFACDDETFRQTYEPVEA